MSELKKSGRTNADLIVCEWVIQNISDHATADESTAEAHESFPRDEVERKHDEIDQAELHDESSEPEDVGFVGWWEVA